MKNLIISFVLVLISFGGTSQTFHEKLNCGCDSTYVMDYRRIYDDYTSSPEYLVETKLSLRYNIEIYFFGDNSNNFQNPNEIIVTIQHPDFPSEVVFGKLCNVEKIFQESDLHSELYQYLKQLVY